MSTLNFICNDTCIKIQVNPSLTLLDVLRNNLSLTGTKEGCREGDCGACTILLGEISNGSVKYRTINSCLYPIGDINGKHVVTVEGLKKSGLNLIQGTMVDGGGTQCGFCTPGFVMSMTGYFVNSEKPNLDSAIQFLDGNICRCTGYTGIKRALEESIQAYYKATTSNNSHFENLVAADIIPEYFSSIMSRLESLELETSEDNNAAVKTNVGGGTDLFVQQWDTIGEKNINLVNKNRIEPISIIDGNISIPSGSTLSAISESEIIKSVFPKISGFLTLFGSTPIRNRATVAGNIVNASPIADFVNILLALNTMLRIEKKDASSTMMPLRDFYLGYKSLNKSPEDLIAELLIPVPKNNYHFNFEKISKRKYLDIASVNTTIYLEESNGVISNARISAGGVAPIPFYLSKSSSFLSQKQIKTDIIKELLEIVKSEIAPISDARGTADYKRLLLVQLIKAHFLTLFPGTIELEDLL